MVQRRRGIIAIGIFAFVAGLGEIVVGFYGNYLGILSHPLMPTLWVALIGVFYSLGGLFILTLRKWGAWLGMFCIAAEVAGRVGVVLTGIAPSEGADAVKILVGGLIAVAVIAYIYARRDAFQ